ncbi:hypothetical protein HQ447_05550 [bacterium]|nr:hypothetical protein [bacterium]
MATIAEIIAAKKTGGTSNIERPTLNVEGKKGKTETLAERVELKEAIDRIDSPGKSERVAAARKSAGLILNQSMPCAPESRGQATPIAGPPEPRGLGARVGEALTVLPAGADSATTMWHEALNAFETELVVLRDPVEPEVCWLAVRLGNGLPPALLHRLPWPLANHPGCPRPVPF